MSTLVSTASDLSRGTAVMVMMCATAGLFVPDFYRLVNPILLPGSYGARIGCRSPRRHRRCCGRSKPVSADHGAGLIVWLGLLTLLLVWSASRWTSRRSAPDLRGHLPTRWIITLFGAIVISLAPVWLAMMIAAIQDGNPSLFATIHVLDLAFVFPTLVVAAVGLWQRRPWSYVLAGPMLVLATTMMGSLVVSEVIAAVRFTPDPLPLAVTFCLIALAAVLLTRVYLRALV